MAGFLAMTREQSSNWVKRSATEFLALWFAFSHPRVRWHAKLVLLVPLFYLLSPFDMVPNALALFGIGQFDDLIVVRYTYLLLQRIIDQDVLEECRERSKARLGQREKTRYRIVLGIALTWLFITALVAWDIYKRLHRRGIV
jgi:uncharacterized membrane protein YkvA (DUF1232 family)